MSKKRAFLYMLPLALTACAHTGGVEIRTVEVAVPAKCPVDPAPEPSTVGNDLTGNAAHDLVIVTQSALELRIWGRSLRAALEACGE